MRPGGASRSFQYRQVRGQLDCAGSGLISEVFWEEEQSLPGSLSLSGYCYFDIPSFPL